MLRISAPPSLALALALLTACPADEPEPSTTDASTSVGTSSTTDTSATTVASADSTTAADTTDGGSTTTGPAGCDPVPERTDDCCCFETLDDGFSVVIVNSCPSESACGDLEIQCPGDDPGCPLSKGKGGGEFWVSDEADLECILTALRDGTEGSLRWTFTGARLPGFARRTTNVHVLPGRAAITDTLEVLDLGGDWSDVTVEGLDPAADFDACLAGAELVDRVACLIEPTDGMATETCTEGGYYEEL